MREKVKTPEKVITPHPETGVKADHENENRGDRFELEHTKQDEAELIGEGVHSL